MLKKGILFVIILLFSIVVYRNFFNNKKVEISSTEQIQLKKHSNEFNQSVNAVITAYLGLKDAFVDADSNKIRQQTNLFIQTLDRIDTLELKKDTSSVYETVMSAINDINLNAQSLLHQHSVLEMRKDFSSLTDVMFPTFFYAVGYEGPKLYLQNCPMAIDDSIPANWISNQYEIVNPYLGNNHPVYKSSMLHCGEVKDSIIAK
jgi:hypothetical protein